MREQKQERNTHAKRPSPTKIATPRRATRTHPHAAGAHQKKRGAHRPGTLAQPTRPTRQPPENAHQSRTLRYAAPYHRHGYMLLHHAHALALTKQRQQALTTRTKRRINQASFQRAAINAPNTRQHLTRVTRLEMHTRVWTQTPNHRLVTTTITNLLSCMISNRINLSPRVLAATHRLHARNSALHERDTPVQ